MSFTREESLRRLREKMARRAPLVGAGAGTGISASSEVEGGADLLICYDSGRARMKGRTSIFGCFSFCNAHDTVRELAREVIPLAQSVPVIAGIYAIDPYVLLPQLIREMHELGFSGVQNFPNTGRVEWYEDTSSIFGKMKSSVGFFSKKEVEMISIAHDNDMIACQYAHSPVEAEIMARGGADVIVAHCGGTVGGLVPSCTEAKPWEATIRLVQDIHDAATAVNPQAIIIAHGGLLVTAEDLKFLLEHTHGISGFFGAGSAERVPAERGVLGATRAFRALRLPE